MNIYIEPDYSKIYLISEVVPTFEDNGVDVLNKIDFFLNGNKVGSFTTNTYSPQPADKLLKHLLFINTNTSLGTRYIFEITPSDILDANSTEFDNGVFSFLFYFDAALDTTKKELGDLIDKNIQCCIGSYLPLNEIDCSCENYSKIIKAAAYIEASKAAIRFGDSSRAVSYYNLANCINCTNCN